MFKDVVEENSAELFSSKTRGQQYFANTKAHR